MSTVAAAAAKFTVTTVNEVRTYSRKIDAVAFATREIEAGAGWVKVTNPKGATVLENVPATPAPATVEAPADMAVCPVGEHTVKVRSFPTTARKTAEGNTARNMNECRACRDARYADLTPTAAR